MGVDTPDIENTPLSRVLRTVQAFWKACGRKDCTPVDGMSIMAYDGFDTGPPKQQRRRLQQLLERSQQQERLAAVQQELPQRRRLLWEP